MNCINHPEMPAVGICTACGKTVCENCKVESQGEIYCKACTATKISNQANMQKSPGLSAFLSLVLGGLGQVYNGQIGKGLLIFCTSWLIIPWIYGIYDAYKTAQGINEGKISLPQRTGCSIAAIAFMLITPFFAVIIALMAAIAVPSFIVAKENAQANFCRTNLRVLYTANEQYANDNNLLPGDAIPSNDNNGIDDGDGIPDVIESYLSKTPICPGGGVYTTRPVKSVPSCSIGGNNTKNTRDDHVYDK